MGIIVDRNISSMIRSEVLFSLQHLSFVLRLFLHAIMAMCVLCSYMCL